MANRISNFRTFLSQRPYILAIIISILLILWMLSGMFQVKVSAAENEQPQEVIPKVKVETMYADAVSDAIELYGRTAPDRITTLKAEISGQVLKVHANRGAAVSQGQKIITLASNELPAQLNQAKALLAQREIEYRGIKTLNADGYQGEVQLSQADANLQAIKAQIAQLEIALENTVIRAPFDGVLNTRFVEQGDYLQGGDDVAIIADLNPLIVTAHVTENQVGKIKVGQQAQVTLLNKSNFTGDVRYIASLADEYTNTFKIEVAINNDGHKLFSGLSSEISLAFEQVQAIKVSPALLALDDQGNLGVKTVNNNTVKFTPINVVKSENDGMWLAGLGSKADVITLGQGFVREGDRVEAVHDVSDKEE
ncbi:efflux RND transporter periplasmic adaptor subunit [Thalassotalea sp. 1_MG-2023]|uniref:efflux RND transporter periplasmic adaptor subunit n=1 Tax=Thalassotalea sp. 1_MG-2023 TaxID=3062680 RepID=UPI0026E33FBE|nr:efflux RND transporter periplasmic adaptor subunit [Thalassotalea sp. 1_MG-2023]MDO6426272.1 efflux RND transporter periplasmic adaptor subunit [Thalassotalea sp. 1_MG-2023]